VGKSEWIEILEDTLTYRVYGRSTIEEKYSCNYSLNPEYQEKFKEGGMKFVGRNGNGAIRVIELKGQSAISPGMALRLSKCLVVLLKVGFLCRTAMTFGKLNKMLIFPE
jgi:hypothetical protein